MSLDKADAIIDGFVFQGRVIVFNNLLASFVHLTSFTYFPSPAPRLRSRHADPALREKHLAKQGRGVEEGDPLLSPRMTGAQPRPSPAGPWCLHAFLLSLQIPSETTVLA